MQVVRDVENVNLEIANVLVLKEKRDKVNNILVLITTTVKV